MSLMTVSNCRETRSSGDPKNKLINDKVIKNQMFGRKKMAAENRKMHMGVKSPNKQPSLAGFAVPV